LAGGIRDRIELGFERYGRAVARRPWVAIAASLLVGLGLASYAPLIEIDSSTEQMLKRSDPVRLRYEAFREQFGRDEVIAIGVAGPRVFSRDFLARLAALHRDLERGVPKLVEITSLVNARDVRGEASQLVVSDLLEEIPDSEAGLAQLETRVLASRTYRDLLVSGDGGFTTIVLETEAYSTFGDVGELAGFDDEAPAGASRPAHRPFLSGEENRQIVEAVNAVVARHQAPGFEISVAGTPPMITRLNELMQRDMQRFVAISLLLIGVLLYFLFGSLAGVVLPLLVVVVSLAAMLGLVVLAGEKMTPPLQIMPTFQLTVGVAYPIHFLAIFFKELRAGATRADAVAHSLGHSGLPIVMTALTTMGGMASFATASLAPLALLGYLVPAGVVLALGFSLVLLPGLVMVIPLRAARFDRTETSGEARVDRLLLALGRTSLRYRFAILGATLVLSALSGAAALSLHFSHNPLDWLPEGDPLRVATGVVNERLGGSTTLDVVVETGRENGLHEPAVLDGIERLQTWAEAYRDEQVDVTRATSLVDVLKETNRALHENRAEHYAIPRERALVAQELLLFENTGADDLERIVDPLFSQARVTLRLPWGDAFGFDRFVTELEARLPELFGDAATPAITGLVGVMSRTLTAVTLSMAWSYVTSLVVVTALMVLLIGNLRGGLVSMIPNLAPILYMHALMAYLRVPLDGFTLMAGATAMGLAVDDTIHFIHVFRREREHCGDAEEAIRRTMTTTGRANLFAAVVLTSGFFVFLISSMQNLAFFGLLTGFAFLAALVVELLVMPGLLVATAVGGQRGAPARVA
jgi:predicted RND superfamily exporter protein